jgi:hypothetical protein
MELVMSGTRLGLKTALLLIAAVTVASAQPEDQAHAPSMTNGERAALERLQNERAIERMREAQRLDMPRVLRCMDRPDMLVGLDRDALRARCGPWQSSSPMTADRTVDELIYREASGTLLLRVIADSKVVSAATP